MRSSPSSSAAHPAPHSKTPAKIHIIGGQWKRTPLPVLSLPGLRPTPNRVRETLFNWLGNQLEGWRCLDLFAGSGALGFEAASRGAKQVWMVEQDHRAIKQLRANQQKLQADMIQIIHGDALPFAARLPAGSLDIAFLDPPFASSSTQNGALATPNKTLIHAICSAWNAVRPGGWIYVEAPLAIDAAAWTTLLEAHCLQDLSKQDRAAVSVPFEAHSVKWVDQLMRYKAFGAVHAHLLQR